MTDLVIRNAVIVSGDAAGTVTEGGIAVSNGRIEAIGKVPDKAQEVIDAQGGIVMPGLVNTHCHAADSLFRGLVENLPLEPWLQTVWKAEGAILNAQTCRLGARLGFAELLLSGCTSVVDMFWHPDSTVAAAEELGVRLAAGGLFFDFTGMDGKTAEDRPRDAEAFFAAHPKTDRLRPLNGPHGAYTVGPDNLKLAKDMADEHGALYTVHCAETEVERQTILDRYGTTVVRHMERIGILDERTILAHCVHLDDEELDILARTGAVVAHNPVSNLKLASGFARVPEMLDRGVHVTLGTDGAISGNDIDMWLALRLAATLHKAASGRPDAVSTSQALHMATLAGAQAMGLGGVTGSLEAGKAADMIVLDTTAPHATPIFDPVTHIVFSASKGDVLHVFVDGEWAVRDRRLVRFDMTETLAEVRALVPAIRASIAA